MAPRCVMRARLCQAVRACASPLPGVCCSVLPCAFVGQSVCSCVLQNEKNIMELGEMTRQNSVVGNQERGVCCVTRRHTHARTHAHGSCS